MGAKSRWNLCEMYMTAQELLQNRVKEREALLQGMVRQLEGDRRIVAAWLFGSIGRGAQDALSDLDIFVIVDDAHIEAICEARREFVAAFGAPVCIVEAPQNAPGGGAYLMALYPGETGAHQVDWYWQARSRAKIPTQTVLLFDRVGLPHDDKPTTFTDNSGQPTRKTSTTIANTVSAFWAMLLITAKYAFRAPDAERMELLPYVLNPLREAAEFANVSLPSLQQETTPHPTFAEKMTLLRLLALEMETVRGEIERAALPLEEREELPKDILPQAERFLEFIKSARQNSTTEERV
jgi:predicted nucleotidyltransferase